MTEACTLRDRRQASTESEQIFVFSEEDLIGDRTMEFRAD